MIIKGGNIAIRCSNCGKETGLSTKNMNTNNKYIISSFVLNKVLHHVGITVGIWYGQK